MTDLDFISWTSTPRFHKYLTITEKIDGTNTCIRILDGVVTAQSRKRLITPGDDNYGFAKWVYENAGALTDVLGYGVHFGEWFGEGIQKNPLGVEGKRFAHFSPWKFQGEARERVENSGLVEFVPVLHEGQADWATIPGIMDDLLWNGTKVKGARMVSQGFGHDDDNMAPPEGIIVWHKESQQKYKILCQNDSIHKGDQ